jgi:hypothetical protein
MKRMMVMAALVCIVALNVNAQTEETESKGQKFFRLTKEADDNPTDWKAQLEAGHFLLDKENGIYNQSQAAKYYERIFHLATDYNKEIPDSIIRETGITLMTLASEKKDIDKALFYIDEMIHADKKGVDIGVAYLNSISVMSMLYSMSKEDFVTSLKYILDFRERITKNNLSGIEHTDVTTAILFEHLLAKYKEMFGDKLFEVELDGKKYILISKGDWNIEKPLMGWMEGEKNDPLLYGEDGKVYDNLHGQMEYSFAYDKTGVVAKEGTNMRMITVTPERRQQMVEAYRNYMKKSKK